ncbi:hypothetical protein B0A49_02999 [Cryomyces minteri]|uniref:DUF6594 domain-containing protein n=1 Tax=Cryomyces minteri TaxID=331657 RepID=A0A4U0XPZ3_9PEZI|nr:hypothetical protein B0A49_02999 [Cryomyces minteri]
MPGLKADLVTMSDSNQQRDLFSAWLGDHFMGWFEARFGHWIKRKDADVEGGLTHYKDTHLNAVSHFVGALLASLLPAISIIVLYFVQNMLARLGAIMAFSAVFAFTLAVFTKATRIEIFAATAAFASVQVVMTDNIVDDVPGRDMELADFRVGVQGVGKDQAAGCFEPMCLARR